MIFVFLVFTIISVIVFYCVGKHYYQTYGGMPSILIFMFAVLIIIGFIGLGTSLWVRTISNTFALEYKSTISTDEFNIEKYDEVKTTRDINEAKVSYTYKIKNTDNAKTISTENGNVYSISVLNSSNRVNHLTVKHNAYFNWTTFMTTHKDEYVFSSK